MARNVEIKAVLSSDEFLLVQENAQAKSDHGPEILLQTDTFFHVPQGRLKLREFSDGVAELIAYERPDQPGPKTSDYLRTECPNAAELHVALTRALGIRGQVVKRRELYLLGQTRIHLDKVDGLGDFLELEVVLRPDQSEASGVDEAHRILGQLGIESPRLVAGAYIDLLETNASTSE